MDGIYSLLFFLASIHLDSYLYGYCFEVMILAAHNPIGIFSGRISYAIFKILQPVLKYFIFLILPFRGEKWVPVYRLLIQWPLDGAALYFAYKYSIFTFIGMLIAIFLVVKERGFYFELGQGEIIKGYSDKDPSKEKPYWLERFYFVFCYVEYSPERFDRFAIIGSIILILSYLPKLFIH